MSNTTVEQCLFVKKIIIALIVRAIMNPKNATIGLKSHRWCVEVGNFGKTAAQSARTAVDGILAFGISTTLTGSADRAERK